jgi:hypothetical protein
MVSDRKSNIVVRLFNLLANLFPFWVLIFSGLALFSPSGLPGSVDR